MMEKAAILESFILVCHEWLWPVHVQFVAKTEIKGNLTESSLAMTESQGGRLYETHKGIWSHWQIFSKVITKKALLSQFEPDQTQYTDQEHSIQEPYVQMHEKASEKREIKFYFCL